MRARGRRRPLQGSPETGYPAPRACARGAPASLSDSDSDSRRPAPRPRGGGVARTGAVRGADSSTITLDDLGLSRQRIAEWRRIRDAGQEVAEDAIDGALAQGRAPTKSDIKRAADEATRPRCPQPGYRAAASPRARGRPTRGHCQQLAVNHTKPAHLHRSARQRRRLYPCPPRAIPSQVAMPYLAGLYVPAWHTTTPRP